MTKIVFAALLLALTIAPANAENINWYKCAAPKDGYGWQKRVIKAIDNKQNIVKFDDDSCLLAEQGIENWKEGDEILLPPNNGNVEIINQSRGNEGLGTSVGD